VGDFEVLAEELEGEAEEGLVLGRLVGGRNVEEFAYEDEVGIRV
jgi:hypothetical protein